MRSPSAPPFELLGQNAITQNWAGQPLTLQVNDSASMPQTPNGSLVLAYFNRATQNNEGQLTYTSGGSQPESLQVPALAKQPSILVKNWQANNLNLTNTSAAGNTPIWVEAFGPGLPGVICQPLTIGNPLPIATTQCAQGTGLPNWLQLLFTSNTANNSILAIIGGPQDASGNNTYVVALNSPSGDTGPGMAPPPAGYYATRGGNSFTLQFNWGSSTIFVANLSPSTAAAVTVTLRSL